MVECIAKVGKKSHGFWLLFGVFFWNFPLFLVESMVCNRCIFPLLFFSLQKLWPFTLFIFSNVNQINIIYKLRI